MISTTTTYSIITAVTAPHECLLIDDYLAWPLKEHWTPKTAGDAKHLCPVAAVDITVAQEHTLNWHHHLLRRNPRPLRCEKIVTELRLQTTTVDPPRKKIPPMPLKTKLPTAPERQTALPAGSQMPKIDIRNLKLKPQAQKALTETKPAPETKPAAPKEEQPTSATETRYIQTWNGPVSYDARSGPPDPKDYDPRY